MSLCSRGVPGTLLWPQLVIALIPFLLSKLVGIFLFPFSWAYWGVSLYPSWIYVGRRSLWAGWENFSGPFASYISLLFFNITLGWTHCPCPVHKTLAQSTFPLAWTLLPLELRFGDEFCLDLLESWSLIFRSSKQIPLFPPFHFVFLLICWFRPCCLCSQCAIWLLL